MYVIEQKNNDGSISVWKHLSPKLIKFIIYTHVSRQSEMFIFGTSPRILHVGFRYGVIL